MQWRLTIFGPHIDDGGCEVYVWFLYCHTMKADYIWSTHWWWRVCSVCVVSILPYNEGWPYLVHTLMMEGVQCMCGFYIAIQWGLTYLVHTLMMEDVWFLYCHTMKADHIWSTHWRWRVCSVCDFYIAIQWRQTIFGPHIDDGGCSVCPYAYVTSTYLIDFIFWKNIAHKCFTGKTYLSTFFCCIFFYLFLRYLWKVKLICLSVQNIATCTYTKFKYCKLSYTAGHYFFKGWSYSMYLDYKCTKCQSVLRRICFVFVICFL
jgi:hypothetical protein